MLDAQEALLANPRAGRQFLLLSHLYARTDAASLATVRRQLLPTRPTATEVRRMRCTMYLDGVVALAAVSAQFYGARPQPSQASSTATRLTGQAAHHAACRMTLEGQRRQAPVVARRVRADGALMCAVRAVPTPQVSVGALSTLAGVGGVVLSARQPVVRCVLWAVASVSR
jgi:hypothetical protein